MQITLNGINACKNRISYDFSYDKSLDNFFSGEEFYLEYQADIDFEKVPKSILSVPFVINLLPLCFIYDISLNLEELDESVFNSILEIKKGFETIYPNNTFYNKINPQKVISNTYETSDKVTCLFSGGVDASFSFLRHRNENLTLFNVWGVDLSLEDKKGHLETEDAFNKIANDFSVGYICIKSTLRTFYNEKFLNSDVYKIIGDYWWHGAQHSIGLLSLLAPYNYLNKIKTNYIASTFTQTELSQGVKCVSYPVIDNALAMASTDVFHDGFDFSRTKKVEFICKECNKLGKSMDLKVCFHYREGKNCSACEKCYRTIVAILVFDNDIEKYGFKLNFKNAKEIKRFLDTHEIGLFRWLPIQEAYLKNPTNKSITWLATYKFNNLSSLKSKVLRIIDKLRRGK